MARNFANPIQKGKRPAILHKPSTPEVGSDTECAGEQQPSWSTTHGGPRRATDFSNGGALSATCKTARSDSRWDQVAFESAGGIRSVLCGVSNESMRRTQQALRVPI